MPVVKEVNFKGEVIGDVTLSDAVFGAPVHVPAMHQVVVAHLANCRVGTHNTKDRGDVRGGGKKPWRQKHTGHARSGSSRSPVWVGGGVAHGPHPRDYHQKVNKKVRRLAFKSAMTSKLNAGEIIVVDELKLAEAKTKLMAKFLGNFETKNTTMLVLPGRDETILRAAGNIEKLETSYVNTLNVYDILKAGKIILTKDALKGVEEVYA